MSDVQDIIAERSKTHGSYARQSECAQRLKDTMRGARGWDRLDASKREALDMVQHKIARVLAGDPAHVDHWDDIAGYATLVANELRKGE